MGLFTPEKTTKDYLKEIAKSQKDLANVEKGYLKAERRRDRAEQRGNVVSTLLDIFDKNDTRVETQEQKEKTRLRSKLDNIHAIEFNPADPAAIAQTLLKMANQIDVWVKQANKTRKYRLHSQAMETKLEQGIMILTSVDPANNMLPYFNKKQKEWQQIKEKQQRRNIIEWVIVIAIPVVSLIVAIATAEEYVGISVLSFLVMACGFLAIIIKYSNNSEGSDND